LGAINSKSLDILLLNSMLNRHKSLRQKLVDKAAQPLKRLIIEGAGPVGLFTAFEMFFAGMDVTIVNDRTDYLRSHRIDTTNKMFFQTRYASKTLKCTRKLVQLY
jgi:threonine dehydrogenase-like Zn-dependent dehydrogenase